MKRRKEKIDGPAKLAEVIRDISDKDKKNVFFIGKMLDDGEIRLNGLTLDDDDYKTLSSVDVDSIDSGDDVLVFKPNEELVILFGAFY